MPALAVGFAAGWILFGLVICSRLTFTGCESTTPIGVALFIYLLLTIFAVTCTEIRFDGRSAEDARFRTIGRVTVVAALAVFLSGCLAAPDCSD